MTKVWRAKVDYGEKGNLQMDEIILEGISTAFLAESSSKYLDDWDQHSATVESNGLTYDVIPIGSDSFAIHESAVAKVSNCLRRDELFPINLSTECTAKLSSRFKTGIWFAIRPRTCIELAEQAKVKYFDGPNKMIRDIKSYVFNESDLNGVSIFRIRFDSYAYYVTQHFVNCFREAKLTGIKFDDTKCKFV